MPSSSALAFDTTIVAEAPSEIWLALPAVMLPALSKAGRSWARLSPVMVSED